MTPYGQYFNPHTMGNPLMNSGQMGIGLPSNENQNNMMSSSNFGQNHHPYGIVPMVPTGPPMGNHNMTTMSNGSPRAQNFHSQGMFCTFSE